MSSSFCPLPFLQLQFQPDGKVAPCCWNQKHVLGDVRKSGVMEIWNGPEIRALRREFLEGKPVSCASQIRELQCPKYFRHLLAFVDPAEVQRQAPGRLDLRLNGKCNLQCVMCDVWRQPNGTYDESDFWEVGPTEIFPYLLELNLLGGEPFVQKDTFRLIDEVSAANPDCGWAFVTNGQWKFRDSIRSRLDRIRIRWIQLSLDSVDPETYAKIRRPASLAGALETLDHLLDYQKEREHAGKGFELAASMCVQAANWREVPEFRRFCLERRVQPWFHFLKEPSELSIFSLERSEREEALQLFESCSSTGMSGNIDHLIRPLSPS